VRRREFITLLVGAASWPLAGRAQQAMPVVGFVHGGTPTGFARALDGFRRGLRETGFIEGRNVSVEFRWAEGRYERLPAMIGDLVARQVAVMYVGGGFAGVLAAKAATSTIPIVFTSGGDPVRQGLITSMSRPEANLTGASLFSFQLEPKRLEILRELVPKAASIGVLTNPTNMNSVFTLPPLSAAANALKLQFGTFNVSNEGEIEAAFAAAAQGHVDGLLIGADPFLNGQYPRIVALAAKHSIPVMGDLREFAVVGGLASYGTNISDVYWQAGNYVGRILKGAKPSELPITQPTKYELVINLRTAKSLGLAVPQTLQVAADEVIE
jgi:putative ABC transport system substrate-binding protein